MNRVGSTCGIWLLGVFVVSGFAGLVYQSIWTQYLGLFLGHSSHAQALVLILFMGGMAAGAWAISRYSEFLKRPLLIYAIIELVIGLLGIAFDGVYQLLTSWAYADWLPALGGGSSTMARWLLATVLVLPQCILLGATFPLMSAGYMRIQPQSQGEVISGLYFSNSFGAAIGALSATYILLPAVGLPGTVLSAGLLNVLVALLVYPLARSDMPVEKLMASEVLTPAARREASVSPWLVLAVAALTGASSFVYEITWVRMLSLALGTTLHSFELMLASFIFGIAFGGLWLRRRADGMASPLRVAGWVQVLMGVAALASMFVYANAFEWVGWLMRTIVRSADGYLMFNAASAIISLLVMFPAAFFAGMTLPLLTLALLRSGRGESSVGRAYAFNTLGAIVGVLAAVHLLMPYVGLKYALVIAAGIDILLGVVLLVKLTEPKFAVYPLRSPLGQSVAAIVLGVSALATSVALITFDPLVLNSSVYRHGSPRLSDSAKILFSRDGATSTVAVYENSNAQGRIRSIATNGKVDAGMATSMDEVPGSDESTMLMLAAIPLAIRDGYERVGVIGFGSGLTTHTLLGDGRVGSVDTIEIEPAMIEGAQKFGGRVSRAFNDRRSNIVIDDAKAYFSSASRKYDLIISEPSNPWVGGTAALFSDEFYKFVPQHLNDDGVFVQWLQLYEITPELVSSVLNGLLGQFEDVRAYLANRGDLILVASPSGKLPEIGSSLFQQSALGAELARVGIDGPESLEDTLAMDDEMLRSFVSLYPSPRNSDFFPYLRLNAPVSRFQSAYTQDFEQAMTASWLPRGEALRSPVKFPGRDVSLRWQMRNAADSIAKLIMNDGSSQGVVQRPDWLRAQLLRTLSGSCELDRAPQESVELILSLSSKTSPYLPQDARLRLWGQRKWLACPPTDQDVLDSLEFASASANRDYDAILAIGNRLLEGRRGQGILADVNSGQYLFGLMQYAALTSGNYDHSRKLTQVYWSRLSPEARGNGALRLISFMAARGPESVGHAHGDAARDRAGRE